MLRRPGIHPIFYIIGTLALVFFANSQGLSLNPSVNGTPVNVPGVGILPSQTPDVNFTPGQGTNPLETAQAMWVLTQAANGNMTPTATLEPGVTPTLGPTVTPQPLIVQMGDIQATIDALKNAQFGYESSEISAGAYVACGVVEQTTSGVRVPLAVVPYVAQLGYTPESSKLTQSVTLCVTIKAGWTFNDLQIDWNQSSIGEYETVSETTNQQGQQVIVQKPTAHLVITAKRPACVTAIHLGKNQTQIAFTQKPSTTWQALAPLFGYSYVNESDAQLQGIYNQAYALAVSPENLTQARDQATTSFTHISTGSGDPDGVLYADLKSLIAATGNWQSFTLETKVMNPANAAFMYCADGVAVP